LNDYNNGDSRTIRRTNPIDNISKNQNTMNSQNNQTIQQRELSRQMINEIRILLAGRKSDMQIISAMTTKGFPANYVAQMIQYVKQIDGANTQNYIMSNMQSGKLRQVSPSSSSTVRLTSANNTSYQSPTAEIHGKRNPIVLIVMLILIIGIGFAVTYLLTMNPGTTVGEKYSLDYKITLSRTEFSIGNSIQYKLDIRLIGGKKNAAIKVDNTVFDSNQDSVFHWTEDKSVDGKLLEIVNKEMPDSMQDGQYYLYSEATLPDGSKKSARSEYFQLTSSNNNPTLNEDDLSNNPDNVESNNDSDNSDLNSNPNADSNADNNGNLDKSREDYSLQEMQAQGADQEEANKEIQDKFALALSYVKSDSPDNAQAASVCLEFTEEALRDSCMTQLAHTSGNYAFCNEINDLFSKDYCYLNYVINTRDYDKCKFIESAESRNSCEALNSENN
jgi:hypothetical protein